MAKREVAYLRVSTDSQVEKFGLDVQKQKIDEYCEKNGITIAEWYIDGGQSGAKMDRPEINRLLSDASDGSIKTVYIYKLDRMSRDVIDTLTLLYKVLPSYGVNIVSMTEDIRTENPMDKIMVTMNAAMNQYEREVIYMRTRAGMVERVKKGYWMGGGNTPYGYYYDRNDGILHPKEDEAEKVRQAYKMYIDGYSCDNIAKILGFKGDRIVDNILKRKSNIGLIEYKGEIYKGLHEPIISEDIYYEAEACRKRRTSNTFIFHRYMLTGLCHCGVCGARMRYQKHGNHHTLVCHSHYKSAKDSLRKAKSCDNVVKNAKVVEDYVNNAFMEFSHTVVKRSETISNAKSIEKALEKSNAKVKKLYRLYVERETDSLLELISEEEDRAKTLKEKLAEERAKERPDNSNKVDEIKDIATMWDRMTPEQKNVALKECVEKVVITGDDVEIYFVAF